VPTTPAAPPSPACSPIAWRGPTPLLRGPRRLLPGRQAPARILLRGRGPPNGTHAGGGRGRAMALEGPARVRL
jgi:hypothetical protein